MNTYLLFSTKQVIFRHIGCQAAHLPLNFIFIFHHTECLRSSSNTNGDRKASDGAEPV